MSESISKAQALRRAGKTVEEIATELEVHPRTVNKWFEKFPVIIDQDDNFDGDVPTTLSELVSSFETIIFNQAARLEHTSKSISMTSHHQLGQLVKVALMIKSLRLLVGGDEDESNEADEKEAKHLREILFQRLEAKFNAEDDNEQEATEEKNIEEKQEDKPELKTYEEFRAQAIEDGHKMREKNKIEEEAAAAPRLRVRPS